MSGEELYQNMLGSAKYGTSGTGFQSTSGYNYAIYYGAGFKQLAEKPPVPKKATNVDWLDKRVEEMRVRL